MNKSTLFFLGLLVAFLLAIPQPSTAAPQTTGGDRGNNQNGGAGIEPLCPVFYVDPVNGDDIQNDGSLSSPFQTIGFAISVASAESSDSTIVLLPGVYANENFPVQLMDGVSIQGTNALNTVILGDGSLDVFQFNNSNDPSEDFSTTCYDGFTVKQGTSGFSMSSGSIGFKPTLSNIVIASCETGVLMMANQGPSADDLDGDGYLEHRPRLVNLTITNCIIGIQDIGDPNDDMGAAEPAILNCLLAYNTLLDFDGVDCNDVVPDGGTISNAFDESKVAPSGVLIGESIPFDNTISTNNVFVSDATCDYRLKPLANGPVYSTLVDQGTTEIDDLSFHNGDTVIMPIGPCMQDIWDADMEGYHNPRIRGTAIDVGADELGQLIVAGFQPMTTQFSQGDDAEIWIAPDGPPTANAQFNTIGYWTDPGSSDYRVWIPKIVPGARPDGTIAPYQVGNIQGEFVLDPTANPQSFTSPLYFGVANPVNSLSTLFPGHRNFQVVFWANGNSGPPVVSNLQSIIIR